MIFFMVKVSLENHVFVSQNSFTGGTVSRLWMGLYTWLLSGHYSPQLGVSGSQDTVPHFNLHLVFEGHT